MCQNKIDGGLKMPDLEKFIKSLKCTWIRLIASPASPWAKLFETSYGPIDLLFKFGPYVKAKLYFYFFTAHHFEILMNNIPDHKYPIVRPCFP